MSRTKLTGKENSITDFLMTCTVLQQLTVARTAAHVQTYFPTIGFEHPKMRAKYIFNT
jgi:hypothetical protein